VIKTEFSVTRPKSEQHNDESVCVDSVRMSSYETPRIHEMHTPKEVLEVITDHKK